MKIQAWWRLVCALDPVSLEPVRNPFLLHRFGKMHAYDADILNEYIRATGDLRDPTARVSYASHELMRLDRTARRKDLAPLWRIQDALRLRRRELEERRGLLFALEEELRDQVCDAAALDEDTLRAFVLPTLVQSYGDVAQVDRARARQLLSECLSRVQEWSAEDGQPRDGLVSLLETLQAGPERIGPVPI